MLSGYPDSFLQSLIWDLNAYNIDEADPEEQQLFKTCLDLLCERKDPEAIETRGYCYYNGTAIYPQDWFKARDSFLELYQLTGSPFAANTLGYIYYYGRCSKGKPDYPQAFYYFSIGHAGGLYESTYKLGDMFFHGLSVAKNTDIAYSLYKTVYDENMDRFVSGDTRCKFADTALRMARYYMGTDPQSHTVIVCRRVSRSAFGCGMIPSTGMKKSGKTLRTRRRKSGKYIQPKPVLSVARSPSGWSG